MDVITERKEDVYLHNPPSLLPMLLPPQIPLLSD